MKRIQRIFRGDTRWMFPVYSLLICVLAYGLLIPLLGFYWDDWPMLWFLKALGPGGFDLVWSMDRPLLGVLFRITTAILGDVAWRWHVFALIMRWASLMSFWWALRELWPRQERLMRWVILLLAVYPGFQQSSIGLIYSHYFLVLGLVGISWGAMLAALHRKRSWMWGVLALACGGFSLFSMEFFLGLELIRPLILWIGLKEYQPARPRLRTGIRRISPYIFIWIVYVLWRAVFVGFHAYKPILLDELREVPLQTLADLGLTIISDMYQATGGAWLAAFIPPSSAEFGRIATIAWFTVTVLAGVSAVVFVIVDQRKPQVPVEGRMSRRWQMLAVGIGSMLLGGWAFWLPDLHLELIFPWDRFTLGWMVGISLFWVVLLDALAQKAWMRNLILVLMVAAGVGAQFRFAVNYQRAWVAQQRFFWQWSWRVPDLEPGTVILANEIPLDYMTDNSLTGVVNLMYAEEEYGDAMPYFVYDLNARIGHGLSGLESDLPIMHTYRATVFSGTTSQALMIYYNPPGCLRVVDQVLDDSSPTLPPLLHEAIHLSRLDLINIDTPENAVLPLHLMGEPPEESWCYFYELADLARQQGNWEQITALGDVAFLSEDRPNQAEERIPFIEGYAHAGQVARAAELTRESMEHNEGARKPLCHVWERVEVSVALDEEGQRVLEEMLEFLECE